jgi:hypothetical protein
MTLNLKHPGVIVGLVIVIIIILFLGTTETFGAEPNPTGNPVGGGAGYTRIISETDPKVTYVVSNEDQLLHALNNATSGNVVFVTGAANIDMSDAVGTKIPSGVTLASDRGLNGSPGGRIFRTRSGLSGDVGYSNFATIVTGNDVRITGLRIEGPDREQNQDLGDNNIMGAIQAGDSQNLEVDNCEISGWSYAGVAFDRSSGSTANGYVHHNYIHHCHAKGYGYGVVIGYGTALIEANLFDYMRHAVADGGCPGSGYEARYNIFLTHSIDAVFDMHPNPQPPSPISHTGDLYKIHHNTIGVTDQAAVSIGAIPKLGLYVDHNRFASTYATVYQWESQGYGNVYMTRNIIGEILYPEGPIHYLKNTVDENTSIQRES